MSDRIHFLAEAAFEGLAIHNAGTILEANQELGSLLGHEPTALVGRNLAEFVVPECRRWFTAALREDCQPTEIAFARPDGSKFQAEIRCRELHQGGAVMHTVAIRDLTHQIAVKEALRRSQAHLEAAQAQAGLGSWEYFPDTQSGTWSKELFRIFRRDPSEGVPTTDEFFGLLHPEDRERVRASRAEALAGRPMTVEYRTNPSQGPVRHLVASMHAFRNAEGRVSCLAGTVLDISDRKAAELARRNEETQYRQLFEQAPIGLGVANAEGRLLEYNDAMLAPGGYRRDDMASIANVRDLYADASQRDKILTLLREHGAVRQEEVRFKRRDGTHYDASMSLVPVSIAGEPCVLAMVQDITPRKAVERALQESEARFRALIEKSHEVITMFERDGTVKYVSPSVSRVLGYDPADLVGISGVELLHPDDVDEAKEMFERISSEPGSVIEISHRLRHADGSYRTVRVVGRNLLNEPGVNAMVSNFHDVTSQHHAQEELRRSEAKYRALFEQAPFGIFQAAPDGSFLTVNRALVQLLGYDHADEVMALDAKTDIYEDVDQLRSFMTHGRRARHGSTTEVRWRHRSGATLTVRLSGRPLVDEQNGMGGFLFIAEDVTPQRTLEEQLFQAQKMEAVGQLTAGIAHDFNNLLTAVLGRAELLCENLPPARPDLQEDVDQIRDAAVRGAEMVKKLLTFSRKEGLGFETLDLREICKETRIMLDVLMPESIEITTHMDSEPCYIRADRGAVQQMLMNLATNSSDAMPEGGTLTIAVEPVVVEPDIRPGQSESERVCVRLSVADTGVGMDDATKERMFDPFFTTKVLGEGTGLGMSMIYGMIKQHNGQIDVATAPGKGTTVSLYFPACPPRDDGPSPQRDREPRGGSETILVVEDNEPIRRVAARILQGAGYQVRLARDGEEALAVLEQAGPTIDLVITDVVMPKIGGAELHRRALDLGCEAPFIFTSGYSEVTHATRPHRPPLAPLLNKPWSTEELKRAVRETLDGHMPTALLR